MDKEPCKYQHILCISAHVEVWQEIRMHPCWQRKKAIWVPTDILKAHPELRRNLTISNDKIASLISLFSRNWTTETTRICYQRLPSL